MNGARRGEVWLADIGKPLGRESAYQRPAVILQLDDLNHLTTVIVVPLTTRLRRCQETHRRNVTTTPAELLPRTCRKGPRDQERPSSSYLGGQCDRVAVGTGAVKCRGKGIGDITTRDPRRGTPRLARCAWRRLRAKRLAAQEKLPLYPPVYQSPSLPPARSSGAREEKASIWN